MQAQWVCSRMENSAVYKSNQLHGQLLKCDRPTNHQHVLQFCPHMQKHARSTGPKESCLQKSYGAPKRTCCRHPNSLTPSSYSNLLFFPTQSAKIVISVQISSYISTCLKTIPECKEQTTHDGFNRPPSRAAATDHHLKLQQQTTIFHLKTGHCHNMWWLGLAHTEDCQRQTGPQSPEHIL